MLHTKKTTVLQNDPYADSYESSPYGGPGTFMDYYGRPMRLGADDDTVIGTIGQLKGAVIDGGRGYNIFQLNGPPAQVMGPVLHESDAWYTVDSAGFLNALRNFQEIDFNGSPGWFGDSYGLDKEAEFEVDASLLNVKRLGVLANFDDAAFCNLTSANLVIAKMGDGLFANNLLAAAASVEDTVTLNLEAARTTPRELNPFNDMRHPASGQYTSGGVVKLQVDAGVKAIVSENVTESTDSDYAKLFLSGAGHVSVGNVMNRETDDGGTSNDNSTIDASKLTGGLYVENDSYVTENLVFNKATGVDSTNLVGSTAGHMDTIRGMGSGDYVDISGDYFAPQWRGNDLSLAHANHAMRISVPGLLPQQFAAAAQYSAEHETVVWFRGRDGNTYIYDDSGSNGYDELGVAGRADVTDFVIKIIGLVTLSFDAGSGHIVA